MAQTKYESTRTLPFSIVGAATLALAFFCVCEYFEAYLPQPDKDFVHWVESSQAVAQSKKSGKPLLYDFSAAWCGPCQILARKVFGDRDSAELINKSFTPVKIIDRSKEDSVNLIQVDALQKKYDIQGFPTLIVDKLDGSELSKQDGFDGKDVTDKFLRQSLVSLPSGYEYMRLNWLDLDKAVEVSSKKNKPLLVMFWTDDKEFSKSTYLSDNELAKLIEKNFVSAEVSMPATASTFKSKEARDLFKRIAVNHAPAMVIVPLDGSTPHYQFGSSHAIDNREFLAKYLSMRKQ